MATAAIHRDDRALNVMVLGTGIVITGPLSDAPSLSADQAERLAEGLSNAAMFLRYGGMRFREGEAGPFVSGFGRDPHSWNVDLNPDDNSPEASDGSGRPGRAMLGDAMAVWLGLQRGQPTIATLAMIFNVTPAMVREAASAHQWLYLIPDDGGCDTDTFVTQEGA